ncbi:beta-mannosidase [Thalassotalea insulae]|uniref:Beta-mannosidase B n=1 Tax=Thalassotalea insulae TaxID=2056778 RepID=A0ABQ6GMY9_9GAMM|nr:glycoside hydrolase family 2 protein [Thalassotalea insulae]GLX77358.1 beta-mannosidase [Thalassotalea insulae]
MPNNEVSKMSNTLCLNGSWQFRQAGDENWLPANVPGCNFTDLLKNGVISDPFYRDQEAQLQWIEHQDWHYRKQFNVTQALLALDEVELVIDGLDTYCQVYLNNHLIHRNDNMFVGYRIGCKQWLEPGENELRLEFRSPINEVMPTFNRNGFTYPAENDKSQERLSVFTRKAPYHYGWDWGPRFVTSGIWRKIKLQGIEKARIENVNVKQIQVSEEVAKLSFDISLQNYQAFSGQLTVSCLNIDGITAQISLVSAEQQTFQLSLNIEHPKLWWPNGLGEPFLYQFEVELADNGQVIDSQLLDIGVRTIEVVNQPDQHGESFYLKVNGVPTFMKGANYIPSDSFLPRVNEQKYQQIFTDAVAANMNMLRVWGGGIYENDEFYRLADQHGILIWQDFMFACSLYPGDSDFIENVKQEVTYNMKRLRNHACLALWCGNNETEMGIEFWQWPETFNYSDELYQRLKQDYDLLFKSVLPELVADLDEQRFYFSSSPIGFWENKADDNRGDNHYWGVWHGEEPFSEFKNRVPRFMSEFGFQSFPLLASVKNYSSEQDWQLDSKVMKTHQKHPRGNSLIKQYMQQEYREPKDFEYFLYLSQVQQGLGMKVAFEAHRSAMPFCMGSLYWQFNDCWPVASWSGIDYYGRWKALHYQAKRSFAPITVFIDQQDGQLLTNIVSDALTATKCQLTERVLTLDGEVLYSRSEQVVVPQLAVSQVNSQSVAALVAGQDITNLVFVAELSLVDTFNQPISEAFHYFACTKDLALKLPEFHCHCRYHQGELQLTVRANSLARQVYVSLEGYSGNWSDNFFDLLPGREKQVSLAVGELSEAEVSLLPEKIKLMSIAQSYQ